MAHEAQERYSDLVLAKVRKELKLKDGVVFNNDYEGSPKAGVVKIPVRDTEVAVSDYRDRYNALAERYKAAKEKLDAIQQEISERTIKREKIEIFLKQLSKANELLTGFDEGLWNTMLDSMTVYSYDKVVFLFKDGSKVEWKIEK